MSLESDPVYAIPAARALARSRWRWRIAAFVLAGLAVLAVSGRFWASNDATGDHIARIRIDGVISTDPVRLRELEAIAKDEKVKAILVAINSPGGTTAGGEELFQALEKIRAQKPVVAVISELGASAAYMTAIASDQIFARNLSIVGSIGVYFSHVDAGKLMETIGVNYEKVQTGPLKAEPDINDPLSGPARVSLQQLVDDSFEWFVDVVAERRSMDRAAVLALADGRIVSGRMGIKNGLIDAAGGEAEAIDWLVSQRDVAEDLPVLTHFPLQATGLEEIMRLIRSEALSAVGLPRQGANALDGLVSLWQAGSFS